MNRRISVIICTFNPVISYLQETLDALRAQTLPFDEWELLIIDNASREPVASKIDVSWHPHFRTVREEEVGVAFARLRGIRETQLDLILFVDDDNILEPDFLTQIVAIDRKHPELGTWGAARIYPRFEEEPSPEIRPYCSMLALRSLSEDSLSASKFPNSSLPYGAGMVIRRVVAEYHLRKKKNHPFLPGRAGARYGCDDDLDICLSGTDLGFSNGVFTRLGLEHLIPSRRLTLAYMYDMKQVMTQSNQTLLMVRYIELGRGIRVVAAPIRALIATLKKIVRTRGVARGFAWQELSGLIQGCWVFLKIMIGGKLRPIESIPTTAPVTPVTS